MPQGIEQLQLRRQPLLIGAIGHRDHHFPFGDGLQGIKGPEQGVGIHDQHPIVALPARPFPQPPAQLVEPFPFGGGLPLQPALQLGIVGAAAEHMALVGGGFGRGSQLGSPALLQAGAQRPFPTQQARLPEHLPLQAAG